MTSFKKFVVVLMALVSIEFISSAQESKGPHGGEVVTDGSYRFEIKVDKKGQAVDVYALGRPKVLPKTLDLTLFRNSDTGETVKLSAINLQDTMPHYQGTVSLSQGSYVGLELRFETSFKSFKVLRRMPNLPQPQGP